MAFGCRLLNQTRKYGLATNSFRFGTVSTPHSTLNRLGIINTGRRNSIALVTTRANHACRSLGERNNVIQRQSCIRRYTEKAEGEIKSKSFAEKVREFWRGPTFKYWFIGVSAFSAWLAYYSLNTYKKTRLNIKMPIVMPNHLIIERTNEMNGVIKAIYECQPLGNKVKCVAICGPSGSGKSVLSNEVADKLMTDVDWNPLGLPKSHVSVFLHGDNLKSFMLSLQGFAASMKIRSSEIKEKVNALDNPYCSATQCKVILELLKEKLEKHPNWVLVVDNLQQGTSEEVLNILKDSILNEESATTWSKGTLILTSDGLNLGQISNVRQFKMEPRFSEIDAIKLLKEMVNIKDGSFETSPTTKALLNKIAYHPMSTVCAGMLIKHRLQQKEISSIDGVLRDLVSDVSKYGAEVMRTSPLGPKDGVSESLIIAELLIAMTLKVLQRNDLHLSATIDLMSACAPRTPVPSVFISRYLSHPSLSLPPMVKPVSPGNLQQMFKANTSNKDENLDPKGKAWSNKSITEYVTNIEDWFKEIWQALKEVYNFYYGKIPEDEIDNSIKILHECELLLSSKLQPGDMESYAMHPLVYAVARQHFLSRAVPQMEATFLVEDEQRFNKQPWFKKMSKYDPNISLIQHRNRQSKADVKPEQASFLVRSYDNALINVSSVLSEPSLKFEEADFRFLNAEDKVKYLQFHLDRISGSLSAEVRVSKQTVSGKTATKYLSVHGDYLRQIHPVEITGMGAKIGDMLTSAKIASSFENDADKAIAEVEQALKLIKEKEPHDLLEIAGVLSQLAGLYNSKEDYENSKKYLEEAIDIYESQRRKDGEYKKPLELGKALGALGVIKGTLGDRSKSKELIERGLMLQQSGAPDLSDEGQSKHFGGEFASSLTDLGHSYVSLGMPLYGRKILDLSLMAHKNIHGEKHPEVVRTLTVLSIAHLMQGHNEESKRLRKEAGKVQAQINALPIY